jgi:histidine ammonia-lyase
MTSPAHSTHTIDEHNYTIHELERLVRDKPVLELHPAVAANIKRGSKFLDAKLADDLHIYGVNTGFGALCEIKLTSGEIKEHQRRLIVSHACGVGEFVSEELSRLVLLIKLLTFRPGVTAISLGTVQRLIDCWNSGLIPAIPKRGTVGASGDLAPLAHMALPLIGLGSVWDSGTVVEAGPALKREGIEPVDLEPKDGLALINGVQYLDGMAVQSLLEMSRLVRGADLVASLSVQAFSTSRTFYHQRYHQTSLHPERGVVAANLRGLIEGSNHHDLPTSNKSQQDPYSFRCIPQVHAAVRQTFGFASTVMEQEINSVSDNPLFFPDDDAILFGGNLHGASTAIVLDYLAIAATELGSISERRAYQLLSGSRGLPDFLIETPGRNSGFMVTQYTAAALVNENKVMSTPASVDTIPTCQMQEDSVSMGGTSGYKLERVVDNLRTILAIELLLAVQAIELNKALVPSAPAKSLCDAFREHVPFLSEDRVMSTDIQRSVEFLTTVGPKFFADLA